MSIPRAVFYSVDITDVNRTLSEEYINSQNPIAIFCERTLTSHTMVYDPNDDKATGLPKGLKEKITIDKPDHGQDR